MEIISVCISILSLALSVALAIRTYLKERESYSVDILDYRDYGADTQFFLCIVNESSCPLTIISICYDEIICELEPKPIETRHRDGSVVRETALFPLSIPAHGACYAYILFRGTAAQHKSPDPETTETFQIQTTRRCSQRTLELPHIQYYLHKENYQ